MKEEVNICLVTLSHVCVALFLNSSKRNNIFVSPFFFTYNDVLSATQIYGDVAGSDRVTDFASVRRCHSDIPIFHPTIHYIFVQLNPNSLEACLHFPDFSYGGLQSSQREYITEG